METCIKQAIKKADQYPDEIIKYEDADYIVYFHKKKFIRLSQHKPHYPENIIEELKADVCSICTIKRHIHYMCMECSKTVCSECYYRISRNGDKCPYCRTHMNI